MFWFAVARTGVLSFVVVYLLRRVSFCLWCVYFCDGAGAVVEVGLQWWMWCWFFPVLMELVYSGGVVQCGRSDGGCGSGVVCCGMWGV